MQLVDGSQLDYAEMGAWWSIFLFNQYHQN